MSPLSAGDRLREAFVVLSDDDLAAWTKVITRSSRLKASRSDLLGRVRLAFGIEDAAATVALKRSLLKSGPEPPAQARRLYAVLAASQLSEFFLSNGSSQTPTREPHIDAAALAVRVLDRAGYEAVFWDLRAAADAWLERRGDVTRSIRPAAPPSELPAEGSSNTERSIGPTQAVDGEGLRDAHNTLVRAVTRRDESVSSMLSHIAAIVDRLAAQQEALAEAHEVMAEQQQITWWLLSRRPAGAIGWGSAYAEAEALNGLTRVLPGPRAALELLRRRFADSQEWNGVPEPISISNDVGVAGFSPMLDLLRGRDTTIAVPVSAADAAFALYDEMLLGRMMNI
ncbi:MAG TPA: hypothetical protein VF533_01155 [Solirubrobacteraceae bacterium]|jgi:hypothetical protein